MTKQFATLDGLKRAATRLKRSTGMSHSAALEQVAREAGFSDYHSAAANLAEPAATRRKQYPVTIIEAWRDRPSKMHGKEARTFLLDVSLEMLLKPHHLKGYLSGCTLGEEGAITGFGRNESRDLARFEVCRVARALQFIAATGLKPTHSQRCYPKGRWDNRPPGADHDNAWYDPKTRSYVLTEEPYPGRVESYAGERAAWALKHGWRTVRVRWGSIYGHGTELYLSAPAKGSVNISALARRLTALGAPYSEGNWPVAGSLGSGLGSASSSKTFWNSERFSAPVEVIEMAPELAAELKHQRDLDIADAGTQAPEPTVIHQGVEISSRWSIAHELDTMRDVVDALSKVVRSRIQSIWCDSKAGAVYSIRILPGRWVEGIEHPIRDAVLSVTGGYNGLIVEGEGKEIWLDPEWAGDDFDYVEPGMD
jgi:hypothetical protein